MHGRDNRVIEQKLLRVAETKCIQANYQRAFNLQNVFITPILKPFPQLLGLSVIFYASLCHAFAAAGPQVWNSLPPNLRLCGLSYGLQFRRLLKTFLFGQ